MIPRSVDRGQGVNDCKVDEVFVEPDGCLLSSQDNR